MGKNCKTISELFFLFLGCAYYFYFASHCVFLGLLKSIFTQLKIVIKFSLFSNSFLGEYKPSTSMFLKLGQSKMT